MGSVKALLDFQMAPLGTKSWRSTPISWGGSSGWR
jgi:hypothetical protein